MEKRYQVFVSSTFEDLQDERREVMQALLALDCIPTGMELFPAADDESWELIKRFIAGCDYYIVILGGRYGSKGPGGKSYTEMEYDYAVSAGLPVLAFLHGDPGKIAAEKTESSEDGRQALTAFKKRIEDARYAKYWTDSKELPGLVALGMSSLMKIKPRVGWVRADQVADESAAQEILRLRRKIDEFETQIERAELAPPPGTDMLAQGDETISIRFGHGPGENQWDLTLSWNAIFSLLGPGLIFQATEGDLKAKLTAAFRSQNRGEVLFPQISDEDFQKVKLQLRALGLIQELKGKSETAGDSALWTLTPYGDRLLTQVAAIRSSKAINA